MWQRANWPALDAMPKDTGLEGYGLPATPPFSRAGAPVQNNTLAASVEWRSALTAASKRIESLNDVVTRTAAWNWGAEVDETLWAIVENFPIEEKGPSLALYDRLAASGNTAALHNLRPRYRLLSRCRRN